MAAPRVVTYVVDEHSCSHARVYLLRVGVLWAPFGGEHAGFERLIGKLVTASGANEARLDGPFVKFGTGQVELIANGGGRWVGAATQSAHEGQGCHYAGNAELVTHSRYVLQPNPGSILLRAG